MSSVIKSVEKVTLTHSSGVTLVQANLTKGQDETACTPFYSIRESTAAVSWIAGNVLPEVFFDNNGGTAQVNSQMLVGDDIQVEIFVVEWDTTKVNVQQGTYTITSGQVSGTAAITAVNQAKAFVTHSERMATTNGFWFDRACHDAYFNSNTEIIFFRYNSSTTQTTTGRYYVVECIGSEFSVQLSGLSNDASTQGSTTFDQTITSIDTSKTFCVGGYAAGNNNDDPVDGAMWWTLTSATNLQFQRLGGGTPAGHFMNTKVFVVTCANDEWSVQRAAPTITSGETADDTTITSIDQALSVINPGSNMSLTYAHVNTTTGVATHILGFTFAANTTVRASRRITGSLAGAYAFEVVQFAAPGISLDLSPGSYATSGVATTLTRSLLFTASPGSHSVTGVDASLISGISVSVLPDSYTLTGVDASFLVDYAIDTLSDSYSLSGVDASLVFVGDLSLTVDPGSYAITGIDASLSRGFSLVVSSGAYTFSGISATLSNYTLSVDAGFYIIPLYLLDETGEPILDELGDYIFDEGYAEALLLGDFAELAAIGSYAVSGIDATLATGLEIVAAPDSYSITGVDANLEYGAVVTASLDSYAVSGVDSDLSVVGSLTAPPGSYATTGIDADLLFGTVLSAEVGTYAVSGIDISITVDYSLDASVDSYSINGIAASLLTVNVYELNANTGSYTATGIDATFAAPWIVDANADTYAVGGIDASLITDYALNTEIGDYAAAGVDASPIRDASVATEIGDYSASGIDVSALVDRIISANPDSYSITGLDADLIADKLISATPTSYIVNGANASLTLIGSYELNADTGTYTASGVDATTISDRFIELNIGSYTSSGLTADLVSYALIASSDAYSISGLNIDAVYIPILPMAPTRKISLEPKVQGLISTEPDVTKDSLRPI